MTTIVLSLPWPPSVNRKFGHVTYLSAKEKAFNATTQAAAIDAFGNRMPVAMKGRIHFLMLLQAPTRMKCDIDNYAKAVIDACVRAGLMENDCQIDSLEIHRGEVVKGGRCTVKIQEMVA